MRTPESLTRALEETRAWLGKIDSEVTLTLDRNASPQWWSLSAFCSLCRKRKSDFVGFADQYFTDAMYGNPKVDITRALCSHMRECVEGCCVPAQTAAEAIGEAVDGLTGFCKTEGQRIADLWNAEVNGVSAPETFDGLTAAECLEIYELRQRDSHAFYMDFNGSPMRCAIAGHIDLTDRQLDIARREWSAALRARAEERKAKERAQVICDDDRWEVE